MGLDMYLNRVHSKHKQDFDMVLALEKEFPDEFTDSEKASLYAEVSTRLYDSKENVAYWRKANAIHRWFVDTAQGGLDDCQTSNALTKDDFIELRDLCKKVIETKDASLLPPQKGFFFGWYEVDDLYFQDIQDTVEKINKVIDTYDDNYIYYYYSSW